MSEEIIIEEKKKEGKLKNILHRIIEIFKIKEISKINFNVFFFSTILLIFLNNFLIAFYLILYGLLSIFLINIISKTLLIIIERKTKFKDNLINFYETKLYYSDINETPNNFIKSILKILLSALISNILIIVLFILFFDLIRSNPIVMVIGIILLIYPFILLIYLILLPILKEGKIKSDLDKELPFASMILTIFSASNMNPYYALSYLARSKFFKGFTKMFFQIEKLRILLNLNPIQSISLYSKRFPVQEVKSLLLTATSISLGSNLYLLFKEKLKDIFKYVEGKINNVVEKFNILTASQIIVFILLPVTIAITSVFIGFSSIFQFIFFLYIFPIIFSVIFYIILKAAIPNYFYIPIKIKKDKKIILFPIINFVLLFLFIIQLITFTLFIFLILLFNLLILYLLVFEEKSKKEKLLRNLPIVIRDISEEIKKGNGVYQAIEKIHDRYDEETNTLLKKIIFAKKLGLNTEDMLDKENIPIIFKQIFTIIDESDRIGIDPSTFEEIADFINKLENNRKIIKLRSNFFAYSSFLLSLLLGFAVGIVSNVLISLSKVFGEINLIYAPSFILSSSINEIILLNEMLYTSSFLNSILLGLFSGSIGEDLKLGSKNALICLALNFLAINLSLFLNLFSI